MTISLGTHACVNVSEAHSASKGSPNNLFAIFIWFFYCFLIGFLSTTDFSFMQGMCLHNMKVLTFGVSPKAFDVIKVVLSHAGLKLKKK